jgi:hypothetical protein
MMQGSQAKNINNDLRRPICSLKSLLNFNDIDTASTNSRCDTLAFDETHPRGKGHEAASLVSSELALQKQAK